MACTTTTDSRPSFPSVFSEAERYSWWSLLSGSEAAFLLVVMALAYTLRASRHLDLSRSGALKLIWIELLRTTGGHQAGCRYDEQDQFSEWMHGYLLLPLIIFHCSFELLGRLVQIRGPRLDRRFLPEGSHVRAELPQDRLRHPRLREEHVLRFPRGRGFRHAAPRKRPYRLRYCPVPSE